VYEECDQSNSLISFFLLHLLAPHFSHLRFLKSSRSFSFSRSSSHLVTLPSPDYTTVTMFSLGLTTLALGALQSVLAINVSNVLIYSMTAGYRHDSIPTAVSEMTRRGVDYGINFINTEDMTKFRDDYLSQFDAIFFLSNTDEGRSCASPCPIQWVF